MFPESFPTGWAGMNPARDRLSRVWRMAAMWAMLALMSALFAREARAQQYTAVDLNPTGFANSSAYSIAGGRQAGGGYHPTVGSHALLWAGSPGSVVDIHPAGVGSSWVKATTGTVHVGGGTFLGLGAFSHALAWVGGSAEDIHPAAFYRSEALGTSGDQHAGWGMFTPAVPGTYSNEVTHAVLWTDVAGHTVAVDLNPPGCVESLAAGVSGGRQVGWGTIPSASTGPLVIPSPSPPLWPTALTNWVGRYLGSIRPGVATSIQTHALLWAGTPNAVVDLHPSGYLGSTASGICGEQQVGFGYAQQGAYAGPPRAFLWTGSAASAVNLNPAGFSLSLATATNGSRQVGLAMPATSSRFHALTWAGSAASAVDLHQLLPGGWTHSYALGIDADGSIVGYAENENDGTTHAFLWKRK
jgi:probable HAF family extracellular repeat protein